MLERTSYWPRFSPSYRVYGNHWRRSIAGRVCEGKCPLTFRIPDWLLDAPVYLYPDEASALRGERIGGSGFWQGKPFPAAGAEQGTAWLVTNKHVIEQGNWTVRINTFSSGLATIETNENEWFFHPNYDLAVRPTGVALGHHKFHLL